MKNKYVMGENIDIEIVNENKLDGVLEFQKDIIDRMEHQEFFCPLTKEEFLEPIRGRDNVYFLKYNNETIGLFVATCDIPNILEEYQLDNNNVILIDSVMIREDFRGYGLQRQILDYLYNRAKELNLDGLVATVHPDNTYSLNNFLYCGYEIINKLTLHGGDRYVVFKNVAN